MAVPNYEFFMILILRLLADGSERTVAEIREAVAAAAGLKDLDLAEAYDNGSLRFNGRIGWALQYMKQAGAIESPSRGVYRITDRGRDLLARYPEGIDNKVLAQFEEFNEFRQRSHASTHAGSSNTTTPGDAATPQERLDDAYDELQNRVAAELLELLRVMDPLRFERVVLEVLIAMGYGGSDASRASVTALSHDGGLDGVIKEDELGLEQVVVQAKRYNSPVDVKYVREFAGSLDEHGTNKGVFFTTDKFTGPALSYVKSIPKRIVLIDGPELARLMVRHGVGITVTKRLDLARVDNDYFDVDPSL